MNHSNDPKPIHGALFAIFLASNLLSACFSKPTSGERSSGSSAGESNISSMNLNSVPDLPKVDASRLKISDIVVSSYINPDFQGAAQPFVDYSYSGSTDYVEVKTCSAATRSCGPTKNLFETNSLLANAPEPGRIVVKLRGCVVPERSSGESNCGPWFETEYEQWVVVDKEKASLQEDYEGIERDVKSLEQQLKKVLALKEKRAEKCKPASEGAEALLKADKTLVAAMTKLGGGLVGALGKKLTEKASSETSSAASSKPGEGNDRKPETDPSSNPDSLGEIFAFAGFGKIGEIISGQNSSHLSTIFNVMKDALTSKSGAQKSIADGISRIFQRDGNSGQGDSKNKPDAKNPSGGGDKPAGAAAAEAATKLSKAGTGSSFKWDVVIGALPSLAEGIFDLNNADRRVSLEGICVDDLGAKQEQALLLAQEQAEQMILNLHTRAQSIRAKLGDKP